MFLTLERHSIISCRLTRLAPKIILRVSVVEVPWTASVTVSTRLELGATAFSVIYGVALFFWLALILLYGISPMRRIYMIKTYCNRHND